MNDECHRLFPALSKEKFEKAVNSGYGGIVMKKAKRIISILLVFVLSVGIFSVGAVAKEDEGKWIAAWGTSPVDFYISLADYADGFIVNGKIPAGSLLRTELTVTAAGEMLRLKFSNEYGDKDVTFSHAVVAKTNTSKAGAIWTTTKRAITFDGSTGVTIPAGKSVWSDPIAMKTDALDKLTVSMYFTEETYVKTCGLFGGQTYFSYSLPKKSDSRYMTNPSEVSIATGTNTYHIIPFLSQIDTYAEDDDAYSAVFIGDSTLVNGMTGYLSTRLVDAGENDIAIINKGIMGNRLFYKGNGLIGNLYGDALLDRFSRDALSVTGCELIIVKIGVNDILHPSSKSMGDKAPYVSAEEIIEGYKKLVEKAHENGKRIYFMEITPWNGYVRDILGNKNDIVWTESLQAMCDTCNDWIKTNDVADGYINSDSLANPENPTSFINQFTKDGIHFSEVGAIAFADCIDVEKIFGIENSRTAAEIFGIDPFKASASETVNKKLLKVRNILLIVRQLLSTLKVEYKPLHNLLDRIIGWLPDENDIAESAERAANRVSSFRI